MEIKFIVSLVLMYLYVYLKTKKSQNKRQEIECVRNLSNTMMIITPCFTRLTRTYFFQTVKSEIFRTSTCRRELFPKPSTCKSLLTKKITSRSHGQTIWNISPHMTTLVWESSPCTITAVSVHDSSKVLRNPKGAKSSFPRGL